MDSCWSGPAGGSASVAEPMEVVGQRLPRVVAIAYGLAAQLIERRVPRT